MAFDPEYPERRKHTAWEEASIRTCDGPAQTARRREEEAEERVDGGGCGLGGRLRVLIARCGSAGEAGLEFAHERLHIWVRLSSLRIGSHELGEEAHEHLLEVLHAVVRRISRNQRHDRKQRVFLLLRFLHGLLDLAGVDFVLHLFLLLTVGIGILNEVLHLDFLFGRVHGRLIDRASRLRNVGGIRGRGALAFLAQFLVRRVCFSAYKTSVSLQSA